MSSVQRLYIGIVCDKRPGLGLVQVYLYRVICCEKVWFLFQASVSLYSLVARQGSSFPIPTFSGNSGLKRLGTCR